MVVLSTTLFVCLFLPSILNLILCLNLSLTGWTVRKGEVLSLNNVAFKIDKEKQIEGRRQIFCINTADPTDEDLTFTQNELYVLNMMIYHRILSH